MQTGNGEFNIIERYGKTKRVICFYRAHNKFYKDVNFNIPKEQNSAWVTVQISKQEYLRKLKYFLFLLRNEVENEADE